MPSRPRPIESSQPDAPTAADSATANSASEEASAGNGQRPPTIHDVAHRSGVAASTVSRAFSRPERVNAETREHILNTATEMGYQPSPIARALPSGRTMTLALLVPDITNPFFFGIIRAAERQAAAAGYTLVLADTDESGAVESSSLRHLSRSVDGFVLSSSRLSEDVLQQTFAKMPLVVINRKITGVPSVVIDNADGMRSSAEHLASLGHRRIVYLAGPRASWSDTRRWRALQSAARRLDLQVFRAGPFAPTMAAGASAADAALLNDATAVIAFNDLMAIGAVQRFGARGIAVPTQMSVVGCDDIFGADICDPALTTLAAPVEDAGRAAVDLLLAVLKQTPDVGGRQITLGSHLSIRSSTGPVTDTSTTRGDS